MPTVLDSLGREWPAVPITNRHYRNTWQSGHEIKCRVETSAQDFQSGPSGSQKRTAARAHAAAPRRSRNVQSRQTQDTGQLE